MTPHDFLKLPLEAVPANSLLSCLLAEASFKCCSKPGANYMIFYHPSICTYCSHLLFFEINIHFHDPPFEVYFLRRSPQRARSDVINMAAQVCPTQSHSQEDKRATVCRYDTAVKTPEPEGEAEAPPTQDYRDWEDHVIRVRGAAMFPPCLSLGWQSTALARTPGSAVSPVGEREGKADTNWRRISGCHPGGPLGSNCVGITEGICRAQPLRLR